MLKYIFNLAYFFNSISLLYGHIFMSYPPSRHNKYSEYYVSKGLVNYNIMSPLLTNPDFFTFPCKGFNKGPATVTFNSNTVQVTLEGVATHGGGHCQFGITYDEKTFLVLKTVMETCLIEGMSYTFELPNNIPSGDVTIFWTWINKIGNREYYMECADVNINNGNINNNVVLSGLELVVANLPGYPQIPEYPEWNTYNGKDLFDNRKTINIQPNVQQPIDQPTNQPTQQSTQQPTNQPTQQSTQQPTNQATQQPTQQPTNQPTQQPTQQPTNQPTQQLRHHLKGNKCIKTIIKMHDCSKETNMLVNENCENGNMRCILNNYEICNNNKWISMNCPIGTVCKPYQEKYILCEN